MPRATPNELSEEERGAGWRLLFDGKTTAGWVGEKGGPLPSGCRVEDGALRCDGGKFHVLTQDDFANFDLTLQWRLSPDGDGGVFFRVPKPGSPVETAVQVQIRPDNTSGSALGLYDVATSAAKPVGEWNLMRILVDGNHVEHWLNGTKVVEYDLGSPEFRDKVKGSWRHKDLRDFAKEPSGSIALQGWTGTVWYRNVKIRVLPSKNAAGLR
jgi:hypothetical protein